MWTPEQHYAEGETFLIAAHEHLENPNQPAQGVALLAAMATAHFAAAACPTDVHPAPYVPVGPCTCQQTKDPTCPLHGERS